MQFHPWRIPLAEPFAASVVRMTGLPDPDTENA
jgi:hypothetical protein